MDEEDEILLDFVIAAAIESDEEDHDEGDLVQRVFVDVERVRYLDGHSFKKHFRMERAVFQRLIFTVGNHLVTRGQLHRIRTPLDISLLCTVWILANPDTFRSCGSQFGVSGGIIHMDYACNIKVLRELAPTFIKWPTEAERERINFFFEEQYGYPGVIGCIDGTHINQTAPLIQPQRYVNRHHRYSILLQGVCDHRILYRDVYVGQPGSVADARMFLRSPISLNLLTRPDLISDDEHLLRDGGYTITKHVLIPYVDDGELTEVQRLQNLTLSKARATIERWFGYSKGKWRRLKFFPNFSLAIALDNIKASVVRHNFIILEGNKPEGLAGGGEHIHVHAEPPAAAFDAERNEAIFKREYIATQLFNGL